MARIISLQSARLRHAESEQHCPKTISDEACETAAVQAGQPSIHRAEVRRAMLLLDIAVQHARLLVQNISDPVRRENFEAQMATIERLLQLARDLASKL